MASNPVSSNMAAAFALMTKERRRPKISGQALLISATDESVDTDPYHQYGTDRFLVRWFMKYGWDLYARTRKPATMCMFHRCAQVLTN